MKKIFIAGHNGMVGSAIHKKLSINSDNKIFTQSRSNLDLTIQSDVNNFFSENNFDEVYLAAAKVGGINANNTYPADFIYENLLIQSNVINSSFKNGVKKLLFLGSSCIYPKFSNQPINENELLTGRLEETNEAYAIAKIAGIKMCESYNKQYDLDYRSIMPTNLYGPNDNFHYKNSHVIPALIRKFHDAKLNNLKNVSIWGTGKVYREFLHVSDMADACIFLMNCDYDKYSKNITHNNSHFNAGSNEEISIHDLAILIAEIIEYDGEIIFDSSMPDGTPRKLLNSKKLNDLGWESQISLRNGLEDTYIWFKENIDLIKCH